MDINTICVCVGVWHNSKMSDNKQIQHVMKQIKYYR